MCVVALLGVIGPRVLIAFWWLADPARWSAVFGGGVILPILGFLFLPWTTLLYVLFWSVDGLSGLGLIFVALGFLADLGSYGSGFLGNRQRTSSNFRD